MQLVLKSGVCMQFVIESDVCVQPVSQTVVCVQLVLKSGVCMQLVIESGVCVQPVSQTVVCMQLVIESGVFVQPVLESGVCVQLALQIHLTRLNKIAIQGKAHMASGQGSHWLMFHICVTCLPEICVNHVSKYIHAISSYTIRRQCLPFHYCPV